MHPKDFRVTKHAIQRFTQRFRLYFPHTPPPLVESLILAQVSKGRVCTRWKDIPFYKNKIQQEHGRDVIFIRRDPVCYVCQPINGGKHMLIVTCLHKIVGEM